MGEQSAPRLGGDDYQHLYSWYELLKLLDPESPILISTSSIQSEKPPAELYIPISEDPTKPVGRDLKHGRQEEAGMPGREQEQ